MPIRTLILLVLVGAAPPLAGQRIDAGIAMGYGRSEFLFTEPTQTVSLSPSLGVRDGPLRLSLTWPVLAQDSRAVSWVGGVPIPTGGPDHRAVAGRRGGGRVPMGDGSGSGGTAPPGDWFLRTGDPWLAGSFALTEARGRLLSLDLMGALKVPTTSLDDGVGTGEWDGSLGASAAFAAGRLLVFADAAWWWFGDLPGLQLVDGPSGSIALGTRIAERIGLLASLQVARSAIPEAEAPVHVGLLLSRAVRSDASVSVGAGWGLTETSRGWSVSVGWNWSRTLHGDVRSGDGHEEKTSNPLIGGFDP